MRILAALFLILIFWLLLLTMSGCGWVMEDAPMVNFTNPRADYIWGFRPDIHGIVFTCLLILVVWLGFKLYDKIKK